jgi:hypothetical protein
MMDETNDELPEGLTLHDTLVVTLEYRFGGMDFWRLRKHWKARHYEDVAREIELLFDISDNANWEK